MNGWKRMPDTLATRARFQDYLETLGRRGPYVRIMRLARLMELRNVPREDVHAECRQLDALDISHLVLRELDYRARTRISTNEPGRPITLRQYAGLDPTPKQEAAA